MMPAFIFSILEAFYNSLLAKHHDSDQSGCSFKSQLTPDGEPQLCVKQVKNPQA